MVEQKIFTDMSKEDQVRSLIDGLLSEYKNVPESLVERVEGLRDVFKVGIAVDSSGKGRSPYVFGRTNLSRALLKYLDPRLDELSMLLAAHNYENVGEFGVSKIKFCTENIAGWSKGVLNASRKVALDEKVPKNLQVSEELDLIRQVVLAVNYVINNVVYKCCKYCFRRIISRKACKFHMAGGSDFYRKTVKVARHKNKQALVSVNAWKKRRLILGDNAKFYSSEHSELSIYSPGIIVDVSLYEVLCAFTNLPWKQAKGIVEDFLLFGFPRVYKRLKGVGDVVNSFGGFVKEAYKSEGLDNEYEVSTNPLWFVGTVIDAEAWFEAEEAAEGAVDNRRKDTTDRDQKIKQLYSSYSLRDVAEKIGVSKTTVSNVIQK